MGLGARLQPQVLRRQSDQHRPGGDTEIAVTFGRMLEPDVVAEARLVAHQRDTVFPGPEMFAVVTRVNRLDQVAVGTIERPSECLGEAIANGLKQNEYGQYLLRMLDGDVF